MNTLRSIAPLAPDRQATLAQIVASHTTLERAVTHWLHQTPPVDVIDVITQDEYTHDVLFTLSDGLVLVYDTT
ncbi:MAG: hypothetical protein AAFV53_13320 [Myxococcota bacterium]